VACSFRRRERWPPAADGIRLAMPGVRTGCWSRGWHRP